MSTPLFVNPELEELRKSIDISSGKLAVEISPEQLQFFVNLMTRSKFYTELLHSGLVKEERDGTPSQYMDKEIVRKDIEFLQRMIDSAKANETVAFTLLPMTAKEYATHQAHVTLAKWRKNDNPLIPK